MAGGFGSRLWPTSTPEMPKQFIPLKSGGSAFINTLHRVKNKDIFENPVIVCAERHRDFISNLTEGLNVDIICEPVGRNTAPVCSVGAIATQKLRDQKSSLLILPSDHFIPDIHSFEMSVLNAIPVVLSERIVTFGKPPQFGNTEFGYIELGKEIGNNSFHVKSFTEKPDAKTADEYFRSTNYVWNTGIYFVKADVILQEMARFQPNIVENTNLSWNKSKHMGHHHVLDVESFTKCPKISIDYAVMERTDKASVQIVDFEWRDLGGQDSISEFVA